ncbi:MAG: nucleoside triphosphate pyrophosphohydrolase [Desulfobacterales bacterium]|nr:nucleoside triphosphate pyrophosphohydrolase [Desulfobacterales bacterium]
METLRGKDGCPWDKVQTPRSMAIYLVEEIYELIDAIESENTTDICEELGDVLFHVFFISTIFREMGHFDIKDVVRKNMEKMILRHPHVFDNIKIDSPDEVRKQWQQLKAIEKKHENKESTLDMLPQRLPALMRAYKISEKAAGTSFDWNDISGVIQKVEEEWSELKCAISEKNGTGNNQDNLILEFGDLLFVLVNLARFSNIHPETALSGAIKKFERRFKQMEKIILKTGKNIKSLSAGEMDMVWEEAIKMDVS